MQWSRLSERVRVPGAASATANVQRPGSSEDYTGVDNLEVMDSAVKYQRFMAGLLTLAAGLPGTERVVADFGAGVGTLARAARSLGWQVTCVDLDPALRARLHADGFDVAASLNVLEHIEDDATVVSAFHRVLKPGAPLLLYVPAFPVLYSSLDRLVGHVRRYRRKGLVDLVESAGFTVQTCNHADSLGFAAALAYRVVGGSGMLDERGVKLYDRFLFPASRGLDRFAKRFFGKNLVLIARRSGE
jgi:SAM-dependent methyltransferase